ncbi:MAG: DUF4153 domain-containing protein [Gemmatimonadaceae bacterium]
MTTTIRPGGEPADIGAAVRESPAPATLHVARRALVAAALLGVAGDVLLRDGMQGVGFPLFVAALLGALGWLARARRAPWTLGACLLVAPVLWFSLALAWRDSGALAFYDLLALGAALAALSTALLRGADWEPAAGIGEYVRAAGSTAKQVAGGAGLLLLRDGDVREMRGQGASRHAGAVARGAVLAMPLLFVFGSLLTAADPLFDRLVRRVIFFDLDTAVSHAAVALCVAWLAGGYLRSALLAAEPAAPRAARARVSLGVVEVALVLGLLDALFLGFVVVQLRYLFGGAAHVAATAGMTYAEYARAGFFELVWVAALSLPTLLAANGLLRREGARDERVFRALAGALLLLLGVVMLSAMQRMRLYQREYGLTETRLFASAAMGWLALVFAWFAATVLRGRAAPFAFGALLSAWLVVAALDVANPDALIARTNVARLAGGARELDGSYLASLSADAAPAVAEAFPSMPAKWSCAVASSLLAELRPERSWTAWNLGRARARRAIAPHAAALRALPCADRSTRAVASP